MTKINNLSYREKNILIVIGGPLILIILWFFVFSNTYDLVMENRQLQERIKKAQEAPESREEIMQQIQSVDEKVKSYIIDSVRNREYLLHLVSNFCKRNSLTLKEFPQVATEKQKELQIETNKVIAEGSFSNLLNLLYEMEQKERTGRPSSVAFNKDYDHKRKKHILSLTIFLQNIRVINNENK